MAASLADCSIYSGTESLKEIQRYKSLNSSRKAAAMDTVSTAAAKKDIAKGKGDIDRLIADTAFHCCILQILV